MKHLLVALLTLIPALASAQIFPFPLSPGTLSDAITFARTSGLQTNTTELARGVSGTPTGWSTDVTSLTSHATTARDSWPYSITSGDWEGPSGVCEPVGASASGDEYKLTYAATDIFAMALAGYLNSTDSFYAGARTRILELTAITDFEAADLSGANQCILDLSSAIPHVLEAAWLMENAGYSSWTEADKEALSDWLAAEVFPVVTWAAENRKNNWGILALGAATSIAAYVDGYVASLTEHDAGTIVPATYIAAVKSTHLPNWLATDVALDSACQAAAEVYGLQSTGGLPDELRRSVGTDDCGETSIAFDCSDSTTCGNSHFYQQKATSGMARLFEMLRRIDGSGTNGYDLTSHGGDDTALEDAIQFATGGDYQTYFVTDTTQGLRYVSGRYYNDGCIIDALDDGSVSVRGGRDYAYTKITHADGVAYVSSTSACSGGAPTYTAPHDSATQFASSVSTIDVGYPSSCGDEGDWIFVAAIHDGNNSAFSAQDDQTSPESFTLLTTGGFATTGGGKTLAYLHRQVGAGEEDLSTKTITVTGTNSDTLAAVSGCVKNATSGSIAAIVDSTADPAAPTDIAITGAATVIVVMANDDDSTWVSAPSNMTEVVVLEGGGGSAIGLGVAYDDVADGGSQTYDPGTFSMEASGQDYFLVTVAYE